MKLKLAIFLSLIASLSFSSFAIKNQQRENTLMYKYQDAQGHTVISNTLPPEAASKGYIILNSMGYEQQKVAPQLSNDAVQTLMQQKQNQAMQAAEQEKQNKANEALLKMFNSVEDIKQSKQDQINSIEILENITKETIKHLEEQLKQNQKSASDYQAKKQGIPSDLKNIILKQQELIKKNNLFLQSKQQEKRRIETQYNEMIERFSAIKQEASSPNTPSLSSPQEQ